MLKNDWYETMIRQLNVLNDLAKSNVKPEDKQVKQTLDIYYNALTEYHNFDEKKVGDYVD